MRDHRLHCCFILIMFAFGATARAQFIAGDTLTGTAAPGAALPCTHASSLAATETYLADGNYSTVNTAAGAAAAGTTLCIPGGTWGWSSTLTFSKNISLIGMGAAVSPDRSTINGTRSACGAVSSQFTYTCIKGAVVLLDATFAAHATQKPRISNITWLTDTGTTGCQTYTRASLNFFGDNASVRFDHNVVDHTSCGGMLISDYTRGVGDHDHFIMNTTLTHSGVVVHQRWQNTGSYGDKSWGVASTVGTTDVWSWEDNDYKHTTGNLLEFFEDDYQGARVRFINNTALNGQFGNHGLETGGRLRSGRHGEYIGNAITFTGEPSGSPIGSRGGNGIYWNNTQAGFLHNSSVVDVGNYRSEVGEPRRWHPWAQCGNRSVTITCSGGLATITDAGHHICGSDGCDVGNTAAGSDRAWIQVFGATPSGFNVTTKVNVVDASHISYSLTCPAGSASGSPTYRSPYDQNTDSTGYTCMDQPGAGGGDYISGDITDGGGTWPSASGSLPTWVNQIVEPVLGLGNKFSGTEFAVTVSSSNTILANVHLYNHDATNCVAGGACTAGIGSGTSLPTTCDGTVKPYFIRTDEGEWDSTNGATPDGKWYRCTSTNTWTAQYGANSSGTPAPYPSALVQ